MDPGPAPRSYETVPVAVARGGGRGPLLIAAFFVLFVALAIVKPWGDGSNPVPNASDVPSPSDRPIASPVSSTPPITIAAEAIPPTVDQTGRLADALAAARSIAGSSAVIAGSWGIAAAGRSGSTGAPGGSSDMRAWTSWQPARPVPWDAPAVLLGALDDARVCAAGPVLPAGPLALGVTAPTDDRLDWVVDGWLVGPDGVTVTSPRVARLPADPVGPPGLSVLVFADGAEWGAGVYRLQVRSGTSRVVIDVCVASPGAGPGGPPRVDPARGGGKAAPGTSPQPSTAARATATGGGARPDPLVGSLLRPLAASLNGHSGQWGIGSGGWVRGPAAGEAWARWQPAVAVPAEQGPSHRVAPRCGDGDPLMAGIIVAITAPVDLAHEWTIGAQRFDASGGPIDAFIARELLPADDRGIDYLVRPDDAQWESGAYRFTVTTPTSSLVLDACLIAP